MANHALTLTGRPAEGQAPFAQTLTLPPEFTARYEIGAALGSGAYGVVHRVRDHRLSRDVALKLLFRHDDPQMVRRFLNEAQLLARIKHPHVVTIYDLEELDGHPAFLLELVEGGSLRDWIVRGPHPPRDALAIAWACLAGLEACHAASAVHRDLKPENILLTAAARPKIADLGIALYADSLSRLTRTGVLVGTPRYMAPEQLAGLEASAASDLHAMGAILFEMLTGKPPFTATRMADLLDQIKHRDAPDLAALVPGLAPGVADLVRRALAKDPAARPASAAAMAEEIKQVLAATGDSSTPELVAEALAPAGPPSAPRRVRGSAPVPRVPRRMPAILGVLTIVLVGISLTLGALRSRPVADAPSAVAAPLQTAQPDAAPRDATRWDEDALWELNKPLQQIADLQGARCETWWRMQSKWAAVPNHDSTGLDGPATIAELRGLRRLLQDDHARVEQVARALESRRAPRPWTDPERVLAARTRALEFSVEAVLDRLAWLEREMPAEVGTFDIELMDRLDHGTYSEATAAHFTEFARLFAPCLRDAAGAGSAARGLPGALVVDAYWVASWLFASGQDAIKMSEVQSGASALTAELGAHGQGEAGAPVTLAPRAALVLWRMARDGIGKREIRDATRGALKDLEALATALPDTREPLEPLFVRVRRDLAKWPNE